MVRAATEGPKAMINAPSGMSVGMPTTPGSSCADAPPPLFAGGPTPVQSPVQVAPAQLAVAAAGGAFAAPAGSASPAGAAALGAATLTAAPSFQAPLPAPLPALAASPTTAPVTATAAPAVAPQRLTSVAPGGQQADANLVEATLAVLRQSPSGAQLVDRLLAVGARINVISDADFRAMGHADAHAFYDPKIDTMFLRRSNLADAANVRFAAVALAHEGTHLLDDVGMVSDPFVREAARRVQAAGGPGTAQGAELQRQALFELTMIKEARAFVFAGQVAKELRVQTSASDPTSVAAAGANDQPTYDRVWQALLASGYNPERRSAAPRNF